MPRIAFTKVTREGLNVEVLNYEGMQVLLLTKPTPVGAEKAVQVLGVVVEEINSPTLTWYYEYGPLPKTVAVSRLVPWLKMRGCQVGVFDQFGNFRGRAA